MGQIGSAFDNAVMESFWGRVQTELLGCQKWHTSLELATRTFATVAVYNSGN